MEDKRMNELQVIDEREILGKRFRVYGDFENLLFLAKDVAEWIDYAKTSNGSYDVSNMLKTVDEDEKTIRKIFVSSKMRNMWFLTEDGFYEVCMQSTKSNAKIFKKEVKKILKTIRKTGKYEEKKKPLTQAELILQQAQWMVEAESRINNIENNVIGLANTIEDNDKSIKRLENNQRRTVTSNHLTVIAYANIKGIKPKSYHAPSIGKKATKICREKDLLIGTTVDSRYGLINTYPVEVLDEIFFE
jgi:toxin-antitoxin system, toxin component, bro family